jgi:hypothetical protein
VAWGIHLAFRETEAPGLRAPSSDPVTPTVSEAAVSQEMVGREKRA